MSELHVNNCAASSGSYLRVSVTLMNHARRIQARAIDRAGELLKLIEPAQGQRTDKPSAAAGTKSRKQAAADAGLSKRQAVTAIRVNNVPRSMLGTQFSPIY